MGILLMKPLLVAIVAAALAGCASKVVEANGQDAAADTAGSMDCSGTPGTPDGVAPCFSNKDCPADMYCESCGGCSSRCFTRTPDKCSFMDVCACDGTRFTDTCTPARAGIATRTCPD